MKQAVDSKFGVASLLDSVRDEWINSFDSLTIEYQDSVIQQFESDLRKVLATQSADGEPTVTRAVDLLVALSETRFVKVATTLLLDCSFYYTRIGRSPHGRMLAEKILASIALPDDLQTLRRLHNLLGVMQMQAADFQSSLSHFEIALSHAYKLRDPLQTIPCLANAGSALKEMGHYHDAISISLSIMAVEHGSPIIAHLKFQCATNGLFCAHRLQDAHLALKFLTAGNALVGDMDMDPVMRATYEYFRAQYLIDTFDHETAEELIVAAKRTIGQTSNPRVEILLRIPEALCEWAQRTEEGYLSSRQKLRDLYQITKKNRLYHDDVLRALMKVYGNAIDQQTAKLGMKYAKELVEYTTSVKRAKFYRQLSDRGVELESEPPRLEFPFDPFANVRQWLATPPQGLPEGHPADAIHGPNAIKARVEKHEELAAIHDDLAKLRTAAILKEIRSVAYDTAENWALAAEFFDDQTGQHCFRVGHLAGMLAREIGLENDYCARIEHAARLHDIGKIGVNEMILLKPGPLDPSELTAMRAHAEVGAFMLQGAKDPVLQMAAVIAKHHHEWWNGAGYPSSLADRRIPLAARICALADVYDALTHARPYKGAWPHRVAVEEMLNLAGVQFDPHLMRPFLRVLERYVPALSEGRIPGLDQLKTNGLIASRKKLMETISGSSR